ncbi:hypothetical protein [Blastococcus sp. CT_GayMR16]|uniref:hypothetical protein n=1 Tax=Blastococcus sp. CT_GayMR16 TaxID=2559607 RepID=UPI0010749AB1|nr:hypothetical protein [Blastococcus sp. CT_GayMR16]TFV86973.1 hypothetical protein E4P38_15130 [Blastococcus sp. CT_GayMR16]
MTLPPDTGDPDVEARYRALYFLHAQSPDFSDIDLGVLPEFRDLTVGGCLRRVAAASAEEIPVSERLAVLYDVARAGLPDHESLQDEYRGVVDSALALRRDRPERDAPDLAPEDLLDDLVRSAADGVPFDTTRSASAFAHHETAFVGENVCTIREVKIGGVRATWVFSEFETDAPFEHVADWVDPRNWSRWGPAFFRRMELLLSPPAPIDISPPPAADQHWHGVFHEEVRLVKLVNTLLRCSYWRGQGAAGMTYDLDVSLDREIDVDRGFLLVTELGTARRVQVLKIVSFTDDWWDRVARLVCPFWTDWIRAAVEGGTKSVPTEPTHTPPLDPSSCVTTMDAWATFLADSARPYIELGSDATSRIRSRAYSADDVLADSAVVWSRLAKDWATAWNVWTDTVDEIAREGLDAGLTPPGMPREAGRRGGTTAAGAAPADVGGSVVMVPGLTGSDRLVCTDLLSIDASTATIPARDVAVTVQALPDGTVGARVQVRDATVPHGLYVGDLNTPDGRLLAPVHFYVSQATGA